MRPRRGRRKSRRSEMQKTLDYYLSLDYPVETRRIDDSLGGGYVASIPSLGSYAFVGDGETPTEAYENLQAAKKEIFEDCLKEGLPIPEPVSEPEYEDYSGKLMLRMPRELHAKLAAAAKRNDTSLNQFILYLLSSREARQDVVREIKEAFLSERRRIA
jgi:antitoxin HicB